MERGGRTHPTSPSALRRDTPLFLFRLYTIVLQYASFFLPPIVTILTSQDHTYFCKLCNLVRVSVSTILAKRFIGICLRRDSIASWNSAIKCLISLFGTPKHFNKYATSIISKNKVGHANPLH